MESIGIILYCQGFILPRPHYPRIREMALCDLSGRNHDLFAYDPSPTDPSYTELDNKYREGVDKAMETHGIPYNQRYPSRSQNDLTTDFHEFITQFGCAEKPNIGIWSGDEIAKSFLEGVGETPTLIPCNDLQLLPTGTVLNDGQRHQYQVQQCASHHKRDPIEEDLETSYLHRCSIEYACALAAKVRKETHFRSPSLVEDLLFQKNLWQMRMEKLLDVLMCCRECQGEMSRAFDKGEGLSWYPDCNTSPCCFVKRIFQEGVHRVMDDYWNPSDYQDSTLDTLAVLNPPSPY